MKTKHFTEWYLELHTDQWEFADEEHQKRYQLILLVQPEPANLVLYFTEHRIKTNLHSFSHQKPIPSNIMLSKSVPPFIRCGQLRGGTSKSPA
jgi:hypothetical protein